MDYKSTLNLPRTDFLMKADLVKREPERLQRWEQERIYEAIQARRAGAPKFVLHDGPPFANGDVHIGTALNKILKDIIVKYKSLRGFDAPYVPGWDCHGLPIEFKVAQEMRRAGNTDADAATIRTACEAYARKYIDIQRAQFKRLGVFGDWGNPYLTLNKEYEAEELRMFADIVAQGFVYRGKKPVYWSIPCRTALAEAEVEYQDHVSQSVYVKFPVIDRPGTFILIWTTTPWTLPANLAVAYNSRFDYTLVLVNGESYIVSVGLLDVVNQKCGWGGYEIIRTVQADEVAHLQFQHPFCNRTGKLIAGDSFVDNVTGTGFVHMAPGHGMDDYLLGLQNGLPIYSPVDDNGCLAHTNDLPVEQQMPAELLGKSILEKHGESDANRAVLHELRGHNMLVHHEHYHHSYPHCWRSKTPIIFRAMDQWFIRIDHPVDATAVDSDQERPKLDAGLSEAVSGNYAKFKEKTLRGKALRTIADPRETEWIPAWGKNRILGAVFTRPDWCISRQRSWGVPIPAFYDAQGNPILDARIVRNAAALIEQHGSNVWFEKSAAELWTALKPADWTGPEPVAKSNDTLDVWIDSGSSSRSVLMRRAELQHNLLGVPASAGPVSADVPSGPPEGGTPNVWQADVYLEGSDQHRGWFQSSLLLSLAGNGAAPFKTVLTHGFMVDADREKISKSKQGQGAYEKPQTAEAYVKKWGADVLRLWVASQDYRNDIIVSEERITKVAETYRVIRNTLRYQLSNLYDFDPAQHTVPDDQLTGLDRWILGEFARLEADVIKAYDAYEFHVVYQKLSQFAAVELSSIYHDVIKDRMYTDAANSPRRRSSQTALHRMVMGLCQMLSPILAFTADEAWEFVPGKVVGSVHASLFECRGLGASNVQQLYWLGLFKLRDKALGDLEAARQAKTIGKSLEADLEIEVSKDFSKHTTDDRDFVREVLNVSHIVWQETNTPDGVQFPPRVTVRKADGQKCERCWHWETDVGSHAEHPTLCGRCVGAVTASPIA